MADDWGCSVDLFGDVPNSVCPKSMTELVEGLTSKRAETPVAKNANLPKSPVQSENVEVIPCIIKRKAVSSAPKILKKKNKNSPVNNNRGEASVKHVTFDVERLLAQEAAKDDREKAQERLILSLGGEAPKRSYTNYKRLREEIINAKNGGDNTSPKKKRV